MQDATLADLTSSARVCQTSQPYNSDGKQYEPTMLNSNHFNYTTQWWKWGGGKGAGPPA